MNRARQITDSLLLIRPANFGFNEQTAASNRFQKQSEEITVEEIQRLAITEFDALIELLRRREINVFVVDDTIAPIKPDAIFPNNWISLHHDGTIFLYPMLSPNRNAERRRDIIENLEKDFQINSVVDLAAAENRVLEGTGSMVFDWQNKIIYACLSPRTDKSLLEKFAALIDYQTLSFTATDADGAAIYHTNVLMCVGEKFAVVCLEAVENAAERNLLRQSLSETEHETIEISREQMNRFAGNMLEVGNRRGEKFVLMSQSARESLNRNQIETLEKHAAILSADITTIETFGGGSVRCMLAEIFCLPRPQNSGFIE